MQVGLHMGGVQSLAHLWRTSLVDTCGVFWCVIAVLLMTTSDLEWAGAERNASVMSADFARFRVGRRGKNMLHFSLCQTLLVMDGDI